jgi:hypothetical protein
MDGEPLGDSTIAARQHFFGLDNVDPRTGAVRDDRVLLSWMGVSSFAAAFNGHVVLLDAWIPRLGPCIPEGVPSSDKWAHSMKYIGSTPDEIAALQPDVYFFGHAHFDHCGDLPAVIRANPGVLVVGAEEHCNDIREHVTDVEFRCMHAFDAGTPFGAMTDLGRDLVPGVEINAVMQPHGWFPPDPDADPVFEWGADACGALADFPPDPADPPSFGGPTGGMVSIAWQFRVGDFAVLWQDTAGPIRDTAVPAALASLPPTAVRLGSIAVSGRSVMTDHLDAVRPKLFVPLHGDPCFFKLKADIVEQLDTLPAERRPMLWFVSDPGDYLRPISFDPAAPIWDPSAPGR